MNLNEYQKLDGLALAAAIQKGEISASEALDAALALADKINPQLNAIVMRHDELARQTAQQKPSGAFGGVPFLLKNLHVALKQTATDGGSQILKDQTADHDSTLVESFKKAGFVIFGKTNSPEFGLTGTTEPRLYGATKNPWQQDLSPGGSSGGAASAVAAGIVPVAHASDGGGSIRLPAAACGLFGLKPTRARVTMAPDRGEGWAGMSANHVVSRSVRDSAAVLDAISAPAPGDPYHAPTPQRSFLDETKTPPGQLRIAFNTKRPDGSQPDQETIDAIHQAAKLCETLGHNLEEAAPELDYQEIGFNQINLIGSNIALLLTQLGENRGRAVVEDDVERATWRIAEWGSKTDAQTYIRSINFIHDLGRRIAAFHQNYDVYLCPVFGVKNFALGTINTMDSDGDAYNHLLREVMPYTGLANMTGQPSMSMPLCWHNDLPLGVMFTARFGDEAMLLRLAAQLEQAQPWADRYQKLFERLA